MARIEAGQTQTEAGSTVMTQGVIPFQVEELGRASQRKQCLSRVLMERHEFSCGDSGHGRSRWSRKSR